MSPFGERTKLLSLKEAASISPYSADYLNFLVRKDKIKATKIGRDWLITRFDLFEYVKKQQTESETRLKHLSKYVDLLDTKNES